LCCDMDFPRFLINVNCELPYIIEIHIKYMILSKIIRTLSEEDEDCHLNYSLAIHPMA